MYVPQSSATAEPRSRAVCLACERFPRDLSPWPEAPDPVLQSAAGISAISPNYAQAPEFSSQGTQHYPGCCPVLCIGGCDDDQKYEAERIDHVPLASRDVLPG